MKAGRTNASAGAIVALVLSLGGGLFLGASAFEQLPPAAAQESCHPDYADPCIPFLPGDALDCDDLSPFVILVDPEQDAYQLDDVGVGDGIGCDEVSSTAVASVLTEGSDAESDGVNVGEPAVVTAAPVVEAPVDAPGATAVPSTGFSTTRKVAIGALATAAIIGLGVQLRGGLPTAPPRRPSEPPKLSGAPSPPPLRTPVAQAVPPQSLARRDSSWIDITWVDRDRAVTQPTPAP